MATFPHTLCRIRLAGMVEQAAPMVARSEVERGTPRQRRTSADARVNLTVPLVFTSAQAVADFDAWFYADALAGAAWFDFTHPRTGAVVQARVLGGELGALTPLAEGFRVAERTVTLEYIRPGFVQLPPGLHTVDAARVLIVQRNSTATFVDDAGVLQTAAANVARYQGGQMLVEGAATNLITNSEAFEASSWVKQGTTVSPGVSVAGPNGVQYVADALTEAATTAQHEAYVPSSAVGRSFSVFVKAAGLRYVALYGFMSGIVCGRTFDLQAATPVSNWAAGAPVATIMQALAGGWFRIGIESAVSFDVGAVCLCQADVTGPPVYAGNVANSVYLFGAQHEAEGITAYTPTTTAPATRAADIITVAA
jgi:hypothetical protein